MKNILVFALMLAFPLTSAVADPVQGPLPPGGWGTDCDNWIQYTDPWASGHLIYDPLYSGGDGWMVCPGCDPVVWPALDIEMWIEMECILTWAETHAKIHRFSDYNDFYLYFHGTSACNNGQYIITTPPDSIGSLNYLPFYVDMFGRTGPSYGTDIPLTWEASVDGGAYALMVDGTAGAKQFLVDACDHYFTIRILVDVEYHQEDGYYYLGGPGCTICPAVPL